MLQIAKNTGSSKSVRYTMVCTVVAFNTERFGACPLTVSCSRLCRRGNALSSVDNIILRHHTSLYSRFLLNSQRISCWLWWLDWDKAACSTQPLMGLAGYAWHFSKKRKTSAVLSRRLLLCDTYVDGPQCTASCPLPKNVTI